MTEAEDEERTVRLALEAAKRMRHRFRRGTLWRTITRAALSHGFMDDSLRLNDIGVDYHDIHPARFRAYVLDVQVYPL